MLYFYLLPLEMKRRRRAPRYLRSCCACEGVAMRWSLKDFGAACDIGLVACDAPLATRDALAVRDWTRPTRDALAAHLRNSGIEADWIVRAENVRDGLHRLAGMTQAMQAGRDEPHLWLGRDIYFGFGKLAALEPATAARCRVPRLRVRENFNQTWNWKALAYALALAPFAALPATDTFTAADGTGLTTYSANWTYIDGSGTNIAINTNAASANRGSNGATAYWNADAFANDQYAQATCVSVVKGTYLGVAVRCAAAADTNYHTEGDGLAGGSDGNYLYKHVNAVETQLGSASTSLSVNDVIKLTAVGTTITPYRNGSIDAIGAQTDSSIASGYAGIHIWGASTSARMDNWEGGNVGGAAGIVAKQTLANALNQAVKRAAYY